MNKKLVDEYLPLAVEALTDPSVQIAENGKVSSAFRGKISSFGAAVSAGSLLSAVALFSAQNGASVDLSKLMAAINFMLKKKIPMQTKDRLFDTVRNCPSKRFMKEQVLSCAAALKLAMNLFDLGNGENEEGQTSDEKPMNTEEGTA
ncbi:MAG: hypothetical protein IJ496_07965 [Ruminococcus sp.]|nr:hypothetical protein [Ruminococcus sp.]